MKTNIYPYHHDAQTCIGFVATDETIKGPKPVVLVAHDWSGRNEFACQKAEMLASLGYVGFAIDMYGDARIGKSTDEKMALMQPLINNRALLRDRITAAFKAAQSMPEVDSHKMAAIGFCFGGLCVLDLARSGADIAGVVSFHGLLGAPEEHQHSPISAKVLVLHGYDDPMVTPTQLNDFCQEMTSKNVDWQVQQFGQTKHAFTNPEANDPALGLAYNAVVEKRAFKTMQHFLQEIF